MGVSRTVRFIDAVSEGAGQLAALASIVLVGGVAGLVLMFSLGEGSVRVQDAAQWLNAALVMLGLAYALKHRSHVRIDVLSSRWSARTRARVEVAGIVLLLLPFAAAIVWLSVDYVAMSWRMGERSGSTGGLPGLYLAKTLLPLGATLLAMQGIAEALRALPVAMGHEPGGARE